MERITISLNQGLAREFDELIRRKGYRNRSEAVRDLIRGAIEEDRQRQPPSGQCVANLLDNALRHAGSGAALTIRVSRMGGSVAIAVEDRVLGNAMGGSSHFAVAADGTVWFSDSSTVHGIDTWRSDIAEATSDIDARQRFLLRRLQPAEFGINRQQPRRRLLPVLR